MKVCGLASKSDELILVVLEIGDDGSVVIDETVKVRKVKLGDHEVAGDLQAFGETVASLLRDNEVEKVFLRRCTYKGSKRSGAASIKIEAVVQQMATNLDVDLVATQTIAANFKKQNVEIPECLAKYQEDAFRTALMGKK